MKENDLTGVVILHAPINMNNDVLNCQAEFIINLESDNSCVKWVSGTQVRFLTKGMDKEQESLSVAYTQNMIDSLGSMCFRLSKAFIGLLTELEERTGYNNDIKGNLHNRNTDYN
jgi:hypothetical protein